MQQFKTTIENIKSICANRYVVPTYQRPYVWEKEQIDKLLLDFYYAYVKNEDHYFIGTVIASEKNHAYELIDGQQRFTTLWLIAFSFYKEGIDTSLNNFLGTSENLRLGFTIRTQVEEYLKLILEHKTVFTEKFSETRINEDEYLHHIAQAVTTIQNMLKQLDFKEEKTLKGFSEFIYRNVLFVQNISPENINLNKLFITLNNSGIQLEQSDILKSKLLRELQTEKKLHSLIWESCEKMGDLFPYNVKSIFQGADWKTIKIDTLSEFRKEIFLNDSGEETDAIATERVYNLADIVNGNTVNLIATSNEKRNNNINKCRSIINFSQLLLHTYRIFLKKKATSDFDLPFHTKNLLNIFESLTTEAEIKEFIQLLWEVRYQFDRFVVKWVEEEEEEMLSLCTVNVDGNGNLKWDTLEKSSLSMLQSVLYHTTNPNTQIWLTPFLYRLLNEETDNLEILEEIDNKLSISLQEDKHATFCLMDANFMETETLDFIQYLNACKGTSFKHYWFQKLEYILWKQWEKTDGRFVNYRIVRKNSVEHVFPQNHEFEKRLDKDETTHDNWLNSFGNLALLNVSQNSSYSNQDVRKKRVDFDSKNTYDSLKLAKIYSGDVTKWSIVEIQQHQEEMLTIINQHYAQI